MNITLALTLCLLSAPATGSVEQTTSAASVQDREPVPDPVVDHAEAAIAALVALLPRLDADGDGLIPPEEWQGVPADRWYRTRRDAFDRNGDHAISPDEVRTAFEIAFGIRDESGPTLRRDNGRIFARQTLFGVYDQDHDQGLSREEFLPRFWGGREAAESLFVVTDHNADSKLSLQELAECETMWQDVTARFRELDQDTDGSISPQELEQKAAGWESPSLVQVTPGFDVDSSGGLSLAEFRATPVANPLLDWRVQRKDRNADGRLELSEFHPRDGWAFLGLSKIFFDRLDDDRSGFLDLREFNFPVDFRQSSPGTAIQAFDRDRNQTLSYYEAFGGDATSDGQVQALSPRHGRLFAESDVDQNGVVDRDEFQDHSELAAAIAGESEWRRSFALRFDRDDSDRDGFVAEAEWLTGVDVKRAPRMRYEFTLCDFDGNDGLTLTEYACLPSLAPVAKRGPVPDPVVDEIDRLVDLIADRAEPEKASTGARAAQISQMVGGVSETDVRQWDSNHDGRLARREIRHALEIACGMRDSGGTLLRRANGEVFDRRTFQSYDADGDEELLVGELVQRYWEGPEKARLAFEAADNNQDRRLSLSELADDSLLWVDTFNIFRRFDTDQSGAVDRQELNSQVKSWEQRYAQMAFPGFDADHNDSLSFLEFRWTPLANPLADWNSRRTDEDYDGCLSLDEFCGRESAVPKGLAAMFMSRLDQDGDGQLSRAELDFFVDLPQVPVEVAFTCLDVDRNGRLALTEVIPQDGRVPQDDATRRRYEEKVMRIEDLFRAADQDHNGDLSLAEFRSNETAVAAITGRQQSTSSATDPTAGQMRAAAGAAAPDSGSWNWRFVVLVTLNLILVGSVAWFVLRS